VEKNEVRGVSPKGGGVLPAGGEEIGKKIKKKKTSGGGFFITGRYERGKNNILGEKILQKIIC